MLIAKLGGMLHKTTSRPTMVASSSNYPPLIQKVVGKELRVPAPHVKNNSSRGLRRTERSIPVPMSGIAFKSSSTPNISPYGIACPEGIRMIPFASATFKM